MNHFMYMELDLTDTGHKVVDGTTSIQNDSNVTVQDLYTALASVSITTLVKSMK